MRTESVFGGVLQEMRLEMEREELWRAQYAALFAMDQFGWHMGEEPPPQPDEDVPPGDA